MQETANLAARAEPGLTLLRADLANAASSGLITHAQAAALWAAWSLDPARPEPDGRAAPSKQTAFNFTTVLYYFGGMLAIGSMSLFMSLGWNALGAGGLLSITLVDIGLCLFGARWLERRGLRVPAGILATLAIVMVPLATWCAQHLLGLWPEGRSWQAFSDFHRFVDGRWLSLEAATLAAALLMLRRHRHPFMVMPVAVTLWYVSMDFVSFVVCDAIGYPIGEWALYRETSLAFGLAMSASAIWTDLRGRLSGSHEDFAFWLYLFGVPMFWSTLSLSDSGSQLGKLSYGVINVAMLLFGAAIGRRVFTVFGGLGITGYVGYLSYQVFGQSLLFPFALCLLGLAVVATGVWWQRREAAIQAWLGAHLPGPLRALTIDMR